MSDRLLIRSESLMLCREAGAEHIRRRAGTLKVDRWQNDTFLQQAKAACLIGAARIRVGWLDPGKRCR